MCMKNMKGYIITTKPEDRVGAISPEEFRTRSMTIIGDPYTDPSDDPQSHIHILIGMLLFSALVYFASHVWPGNCC